MPVAVEPYQTTHIPAVAAFNQRLVSGGGDPAFCFPSAPEPAWLPPQPGATLWQELFVASDGPAIRGGYVLKHQMFQLDGLPQNVGYYHGPISEGIVNRSHAMVGVHLLRDALRRQPLLYALGMGGIDRPLPRMLTSLKWQITLVPFYFRILRARRALHHLRAVRSTPLRRWALDLAAYSGLGAAGAALFQRSLHRADYRIADSFSAEATELWERANTAYSFCAVRDAATLNTLYPASDQRFHRVALNGGWAVVLCTQMHEDKYFGSLRLGSIIDTFALPGHEAAVIGAASRHLDSLGADLVVSNQSHAAWQTAMTDNGYRSGPSNFLFAASPALAPLLGRKDHIHLLRGDGDGPIHL